MGIIAGTVLILGVYAAYLIWYFRWERHNTAGMAYYGRSPVDRRSMKRWIAVLSLPVKPVLRTLGSIGRSRLTMPTFDYDGLAGPPGVSSPDVFASARSYQPQPEDVFVATQMRCGTTWMQQLVYQVVTLGEGDFTESGRTHLYAISPWIEAINSVPVGEAPTVGHRPTRIVKTHLPASHCPYSAAAKYIYVARHPVSCFASIMDFNRSMLGPLVPPLDTMVSWFCSDRMYWRPWPQHVDGWWRWSETRNNVLFVHFEEMTRDLGAVVDRVAEFLGVGLRPAERERIMEKCSFKYMKDHEESFEMAPPTMFSVSGGEFMASGKEKRHEDVTPVVRERIIAYCRETLMASAYPAGRFYSDLVG